MTDGDRARDDTRLSKASRRGILKASAACLHPSNTRLEACESARASARRGTTRGFHSFHAVSNSLHYPPPPDRPYHLTRLRRRALISFYQFAEPFLHGGGVECGRFVESGCQNRNPTLQLQTTRAHHECWIQATSNTQIKHICTVLHASVRVSLPPCCTANYPIRSLPVPTREPQTRLVHLVTGN